MDTVMTVSELLIANIDKIRTTKLGAQRIQRNLSIQSDSVAYCIKEVLKYKHNITRKGKNYYVTTDDAIITINASSFTIITAHKIKKG